MTIPWLMNCDHKDDGWCVGCVASLGNEAAELRRFALNAVSTAQESRDAKTGLEQILLMAERVLTPSSFERDAESDLAVCDAADPSEWKAGGDDEFYWCGPQSWGGGDLIQFRREDFDSGEDQKAWEQFKKDCQFVAMARVALPYWIRRCIKAESK